MDKPRVALVIPALNEAGTISTVVAGARQYGQVIVVDDASTDQTGCIAMEAGALLKRNSTNLQYDGALEVGLRMALEQGHDFAVTIDADGQHDPQDLPKIIAALHDGADLVIGVRPKSARFAETWFKYVGNRLWGIHDPLCGMKGYRLSWLRRYAIFDSYRSIGTQLAIRMLKDGARLRQMPIAARPGHHQSRFGGVVRANWKILRSLIIGIYAFAIRG